METEVVSLPPHHFVLVHGAGLGAWCWFKLRRLLEDAGHKVSCFDLTGGGIDRSDANTVLTFEEYNKPLLDFMYALPTNEKVILVGHSAGGLSVTQATRKFGEKILVAIYVAATMLRSGFVSQEDLKDGVPNLSRFGDVLELKFGLGSNRPPTSATLRQQFQREILYNLSPAEDSTLASMLLRPWPLTALTSAKFEGGDEKVDLVKRVFVKTLQDHMITPEQQEAMIGRWQPYEVVPVDSDHSPFFSAHRKLCHVLVKATAHALNVN